MVLLVGLKVLSQLTNPRTQNRNLDFRRTGVGIVGTEALNQVGFRCRCQHSVLVTPKSSNSDCQINLNVSSKITTDCTGIATPPGVPGGCLGSISDLYRSSTAQ